MLYKEKDSDAPPRFWLVEGNSSRSAQLTGLGKYVLYEIQVLAFTRIGDGGPSHPPVLERTLDDGEVTPPGAWGLHFLPSPTAPAQPYPSWGLPPPQGELWPQASAGEWVSEGHLPLQGGLATDLTPKGKKSAGAF